MLFKILETLPEETDCTTTNVNPDTVLPLIPLDLHDGFIHLSTGEQVEGTLNAFFTKHKVAYVLYVDGPSTPQDTIPQGQFGNRDRSSLKWDWMDSRQQYFPHLYGDLLNKDIVKWKKLSRDDTETPWLFKP